MGRESLVPLCIEKSADMMVAILAILKAGGAYVPLDIAYPPERIKFMIDDTNAKLIVTNRKNRASLNVTGPEIVEIDSETTRDMIGQQPTGHLANSVDVNQLAYVMYTSGSTGRPKGTLV